MFYQVIGNPANAFIIIVAVVIGFVSALGFLDARKKAKENENNLPKF
jgi:UDP-N-acetylmuramyl pentapeptide phosphotransferase/UDP-N-acetylglucosamine-1-phosphate transferase